MMEPGPVLRVSKRNYEFKIDHGHDLDKECQQCRNFCDTIVRYSQSLAYPDEVQRQRILNGPKRQNKVQKSSQSQHRKFQRIGEIPEKIKQKQLSDINSKIDKYKQEMQVLKAQNQQLISKLKKCEQKEQFISQNINIQRLHLRQEITNNEQQINKCQLEIKSLKQEKQHLQFQLKTISEHIGVVANEFLPRVNMQKVNVRHNAKQILEIGRRALLRSDLLNKMVSNLRSLIQHTIVSFQGIFGHHSYQRLKASKQGDFHQVDGQFQKLYGNFIQLEEHIDTQLYKIRHT